MQKNSNIIQTIGSTRDIAVENKSVKRIHFPQTPAAAHKSLTKHLKGVIIICAKMGDV